MEAQAQHNQNNGTAFRLFHKEARRELKISVEGKVPSFCAKQIYFGIKLDGELESLRKKSTTLIRLLKRLAGIAGMRVPPYSTQPPLP